jgi:hypothetical protein
MTFTLAQRQDMQMFLTLICEVMQRDGKIELDCGHYAMYSHTSHSDGKIELDCGHYAMYGNSTQEIVLMVEEPEHYVAMCGACASKSGDETFPTISGCDDEWVPRNVEDIEEVEEVMRCNC